MENAWLLIIPLSITILLCFFTFSNQNKPHKPKRLPPNPPILTALLNPSFVRNRPITTLHGGGGAFSSSRTVILISDHALTHKALIHHAAAFADRPKPTSANHHHHLTINSASHGPLWRLLRRNLTSEILSPSKIKSYAHARKWVLDVLLDDLKSQSETNNAVTVDHTFRHAMFRLLMMMCFGENPDKATVRAVEAAQRDMIACTVRLNARGLWPRLLFKKRWREFLNISRAQQDLLLPLIRERKNHKHNSSFGYVDSLFKIEIQENGVVRRLDEDEMVSLCAEFLQGGTDTTSATLQWVMANVVKHPHVQAKLFEEIASVVRERERVNEEDLPRMRYVKAVVLEGLRRHPPLQFGLPHAVSEEVSVGGYVIPRNATVRFAVAEMGWDEKVWEEPMEFRPERFMKGGEAEGVDITGGGDFKMMPFGVGRRVCPGLGIAMLHLEYFVANLVRVFEWKVLEGEGVDLSEKVEFTAVMKKPLKAMILVRK
ncbi:Cytochrome P450 89A9 [Acorus gramineus]|uniref:Cytochrome P450 89A9 n=1 Tax=Acorus gramineus TaxID=55184 RepID=A0AAV9AEC8_ACOGR|nr:Cytochrome P450 89A9 [Acorus gramineus]